MAVVSLLDNRTNDAKSFERADTLVGPVTSDVYLIPQGLKIGCSLALTLKSATGSCKVQSTISPRAEVVGETANVEWADWERGTISESTQEWVGLARGLRVVVTSGTWKIELVGE